MSQLRATAKSASSTLRVLCFGNEWTSGRTRHSLGLCSMLEKQQRTSFPVQSVVLDPQFPKPPPLCDNLKDKIYHPYGQALKTRLDIWAQETHPGTQVKVEWNGEPQSVGSVEWDGRLRKALHVEEKWDWVVMLGSPYGNADQLAASLRSRVDPIRPNLVMDALSRSWAAALSTGSKVLALTIPDHDEAAGLPVPHEVNCMIMETRMRGLHTFNLNTAIPYYPVNTVAHRQYWSDKSNLTPEGYDLMGWYIGEALAGIMDNKTPEWIEQLAVRFEVESEIKKEQRLAQQQKQEELDAAQSTQKQQSVRRPAPRTPDWTVEPGDRFEDEKDIMEAGRLAYQQMQEEVDAESEKHTPRGAKQSVRRPTAPVPTPAPRRKRFGLQQRDDDGDFRPQPRRPEAAPQSPRPSYRERKEQVEQDDHRPVPRRPEARPDQVYMNKGYEDDSDDYPRPHRRPQPAREENRPQRKSSFFLRGNDQENRASHPPRRQFGFAREDAEEDFRPQRPYGEERDRPPHRQFDHGGKNPISQRRLVNMGLVRGNDQDDEDFGERFVQKMLAQEKARDMLKAMDDDYDELRPKAAPGGKEGAEAHREAHRRWNVVSRQLGLGSGRPMERRTHNFGPRKR